MGQWVDESGLVGWGRLDPLPRCATGQPKPAGGLARANFNCVGGWVSEWVGGLGGGGLWVVGGIKELNVEC